MSDAPEKKVEIRIPSVLGYEKVAMESAASVAKSMGFSADRIEDLKTAISEACVNAIEHGNRLDQSTNVGIVLRAEKSRLQVEVQDEGKGVGAVESPKIEEKMEGKETPRGWGVFLIQNLMDEVNIEARPEGGNVVRMVIHLEK